MGTTNYSRLNQLAERLKAGPTQRPPQPSRPPRRRPAPLPAREPDAVLLYSRQTSSYIANLCNTTLEFRLEATPLPAQDSVRVHSLLYLCRPQPRYTSRNQCNEMLQGPTVDGQEEFLSGLRSVPVPGAATSLIAALYVADYKTNHLDRQEYPRTAVVLLGKPEGSRPGWMVVVVCWDRYKPKYRPANEAFATARIRQVLPRLPEWLKLLPSDTD